MVDTLLNLLGMATLLGLIIFIFWGYSDIKSTSNKLIYICKILVYLAVAFCLFELFDYLTDLGHFEEEVKNIHE